MKKCYAALVVLLLSSLGFNASYAKDYETSAKSVVEAAKPININTATAEQLQGLKGIGEKKHKQ